LIRRRAGVAGVAGAQTSTCHRRPRSQETAL
jgi:hypothetical protein